MAAKFVLNAVLMPFLGLPGIAAATAAVYALGYRSPSGVFTPGD